MFGGSADKWAESAEEGSAVPWTESAEKLSKLADTTSLRLRKYRSMFIHHNTCMCNATVFR